jgi:hypothetical protein
MPVKKRRKAVKRKPKLKSPVCKPCWELKYCPYGPLVEFFPLSPASFSLTEIRRIHSEVTAGFVKGRNRNEAKILSEVERFLWSEPSQWQYIKRFDSTELACNVFGHICPVFLTAEPFTETKEGRHVSRHIPRAVMLQVVRRDGQICQKCHKPVPDDEVEFDHEIPFSRGGPVTAANLRLVHRRCNRTKSDSLAELLWSHEEADGQT